MIRIICTNCKTELNIDDAFAGGVCRCQHCGTIQTVPAHLKGSGGTGNSGSSSKPGPKKNGDAEPEKQKALFVSKGRGSTNAVETDSEKPPVNRKLILGAMGIAFLVVIVLIYVLHGR